MHIPDREEVYEAWVAVHDAEKALAAAKAAHQTLADARYGAGLPHTVRDDIAALGIAPSDAK